jgi:hypothetical protein
MSHVNIAILENTEEWENRVSVLDDTCLTLSWNTGKQNHISSCDKNPHAAHEIPLRDHEAQ